VTAATGFSEGTFTAVEEGSFPAVEVVSECFMATEWSKTFSRKALAIGLSRIFPNVPSRRGAIAKSVANVACTTITAPTSATNRRAPEMFPSSTPQNTFSRAFTRSTAVRPQYNRSNFFVARGIAGNRRKSISRGTRTGRPFRYFLRDFSREASNFPSGMAARNSRRVRILGLSSRASQAKRGRLMEICMTVFLR